MKKIWTSGLILFLLLVASVCAQAKGFNNLSFNGSYIMRHPVYIAVWEPFIKATEEKFPGKNGISFNYFAANELYPESEALAALTDGRVDFGAFNPAKFPGKLNLIKVAEIPGLAPNSVVASQVTEDLLEEFPEIRAEMPENSLAITSWSSPPVAIHTIKPVKTLGELKGQKLVVWNTQTKDLADALGVVPVRINPGDTYLALSKGMADGVICPTPPIRSFKIAELVPYHLNIPLGGGTFVVAANEALWKDMPEEMQNWLKQELGSKSALAIGQALDNGGAADVKILRDNGHEFYELSPEDQAEAQKVLSVFVDRWKNETCKNEDPAVVEKVYQFAVDRAKYHQQQQEAGAYDKQVEFSAK